MRVLLVCKCPVKGEMKACLYAGNILVTIPLDIVCLMDIHHKCDLQKQRALVNVQYLELLCLWGTEGSNFAIGPFSGHVVI